MLCFCNQWEFFPSLPKDFQQVREGPQCPHPRSLWSRPTQVETTSLNSTKVSGPHGIPAWLLRENSDFLTEPVKDNLGCSFKESCLPPSWKSAEVVPVPKEKPVKDVNKHLRPISLTPVLSKIAEEFIVKEHVKPAVVEKIAENQYGTIPKS